MAKKFDVIIIGAGVVGCMIARALSRYKLKVLLIDKDADIGMGASSANSAIVHAGYDPMPGSLKARMNVAANPMWDQLSGELGFPFERRGDYVVAVGEEELRALDRLLQQGIANGVPGMHMISAEEMRLREPNINPQVSGALWAPTGGLCDPFMVTVAAAENAVMNGVTVMVNTAFEDFIMEGKRVTGIRTNRGVFLCRWAVNAAGIHSDTVMHKAGLRPDFKISPRRGEYCVLDREEIVINNVLFPTPSRASKGILVTATLHGNAMVGPTSDPIKDKDGTEVSADGLSSVWAGAQKLVPSLSPRFTIGVFAGLRASGNAPCKSPFVNYTGDFIIEIPSEVQGMVNLGGIESPGLTSSPAIAEMVVDLLKDAGEALTPKRDWNPIRPPRPRFRHLSREDRIRLISMDPRYARVICRCELVTEGEILAEVHAPIPALTYDAIKRRTWLGTGRCQGGFDMPRVVALLSQELGIPPEAVTKKGAGSEFLLRKTKEAEVPHGAQG